jgi:hypothetical protein
VQHGEQDVGHERNHENLRGEFAVVAYRLQTILGISDKNENCDCDRHHCIDDRRPYRKRLKLGGWLQDRHRDHAYERNCNDGSRYSQGPSPKKSLELKLLRLIHYSFALSLHRFPKYTSNGLRLGLCYPFGRFAFQVCCKTLCETILDAEAVAPTSELKMGFGQWTRTTAKNGSLATLRLLIAPAKSQNDLL